MESMDETAPLFCPDFNPVQSLQKMRQEPTPENMRHFFLEIKQAHFLVPCALKNEQSVKKVYPASLTMPKGEKVLPAFTDLSEFKKWPFVKLKVFVFSFDELKYLVMEDLQRQNLAGIAINPFGQTLLLKQSQIAEIDTVLQGLSVQRVNHAKGVRLLKPENLPSGLKEGLKTLFQPRKEVRRAFLLWAQGPKESVPHWLLLIEFEGREIELFPQVADVVRSYMKQGDTFELMKATPYFLRAVEAEAIPIYCCQEHS